MSAKAKLSKEQLSQMMADYASGYTLSLLREKYGISNPGYWVNKGKKKTKPTDLNIEIKFHVSQRTMELLINVARVKDVTVNQLISDTIQAKAAECSIDIEAELNRVREKLLKEQIESFTL